MSKMKIAVAGLVSVFSLLLAPTIDRAQAHTFTVLHSFEGGASDGATPEAGLIFDSAGNLYGTTTQGGAGDCSPDVGCGTVFKVTPDGDETVLHSFMAGNDGAEPGGRLLFDSAGDLLGTTMYGDRSPDAISAVFLVAEPYSRSCRTARNRLSTPSEAIVVTAFARKASALWTVKAIFMAPLPREAATRVGPVARDAVQCSNWHTA
jgi:uncharacterized repeat protein (TIGR03803 family)